MSLKRSLTAFALVAFGLVSVVETAEPRPKIRALVITGGHGFDQKAFYGIFDAMPDVEYGKLELPEEADELKPGAGEEVRRAGVLRHDR